MCPTRCERNREENRPRALRGSANTAKSDSHDIQTPHSPPSSLPESESDRLRSTWSVRRRACEAFPGPDAGPLDPQSPHTAAALPGRLRIAPRRAAAAAGRRCRAIDGQAVTGGSRAGSFSPHATPKAACWHLGPGGSASERTRVENPRRLVLRPCLERDPAPEAPGSLGGAPARGGAATGSAASGLNLVGRLTTRPENPHIRPTPSGCVDPSEL